LNGEFKRWEARIRQEKDEAWVRFKQPVEWDRDVPYDIRERAFQCTVTTIKALETLPRTVGYVQRQLLRAATSVGANLAEADNAESKTDFRHKVAVSAKEARERRYWIRLLRASVSQREIWRRQQREIEEITHILGAILRNARR
jgi:four helix bundle protein